MSATEVSTGAGTAGGDMLSLKAAALGARVVQGLELVALLESEGFTDRDARVAGHRDLFALSEAYLSARPAREDARPRQLPADRVHRADPAPPRTSEPDRAVAPRPSRALMLRGVVFFLPGVALAALLPSRMSGWEALSLAGSLLIAWAAVQAVSFVSYQQSGLGPDAATPFLKLSLVLTVVLAAAVATALAVTGVTGLLISLAVFGQFCVMTTTAVLILRRREVLLVAILLPGAVAGAARLASGEPSPWVALVGLLSLVLTVPTAWWACRERPASRAPLIATPGATLPHAAHGALSGILALWLPAAVGFDPAVAVAMSTLVLVLGMAEYLLVHLRNEGRADLRRHVEVAAFRRSVTRRLFVALAMNAALVFATQVLSVVIMGPFLPSGAEGSLALAGVMALLGTTFLAQGVAVALFGVTRVLPFGTGAAAVLGVVSFLDLTPIIPAFALVLGALLVASVVVAMRQCFVIAHHR